MSKRAIGRIETFFAPPRWLFVRVESEDGAVGWGEASLEGWAEAVDGVFELITESLKSGEEVRVTGFGVFVVSARAGGKGRNPQTGEEITIKASKAARFRAGKPLKDALNT